MDNLKLNAISLRKCILFQIVTNLDKCGAWGRCLRELNQRPKFDTTSTAVQG